MSYVRRLTDKDATWARAWTADALADLVTISAIGGTEGPRRGDTAYVTAESKYYFWMDDDSWIPISGDTPLGAEVYRATDLALVAATPVAITFSNEVRDDNNFWEGVTNPTRITINKDGWCSISAQATVEATANDMIQLRIRVNGSATDRVRQDTYNPNSTHVGQVQANIYLVATDYFEVYVELLNSNGTLKGGADKTLVQIVGY